MKNQVLIAGHTHIVKLQSQAQDQELTLLSLSNNKNNNKNKNPHLNFLIRNSTTCLIFGIQTQHSPINQEFTLFTPCLQPHPPNLNLTNPFFKSKTKVEFDTVRPSLVFLLIHRMQARTHQDLKEPNFYVKLPPNDNLFPASTQQG